MSVQESNSIKTAALTTALMAVSASFIIVANPVSVRSVAASDLSRGCEQVGGTYRSLSHGHWMCLYSEANPKGSLGFYCDPNRNCTDLVYGRRPNGEIALEFVAPISEELTDD